MGIFLSGNFPNGQFPKSAIAAALGPYHVLAAMLGPLNGYIFGKKWLYFWLVIFLIIIIFLVVVF